MTSGAEACQPRPRAFETYLDEPIQPILLATTKLSPYDPLYEVNAAYLDGVAVLARDNKGRGVVPIPRVTAALALADSRGWQREFDPLGEKGRELKEALDSNDGEPWRVIIVRNAGVTAVRLSVPAGFWGGNDNSSSVPEHCLITVPGEEATFSDVINAAYEVFPGFSRRIAAAERGDLRRVYDQTLTDREMGYTPSFLVGEKSLSRSQEGWGGLEYVTTLEEWDELTQQVQAIQARSAFDKLLGDFMSSSRLNPGTSFDAFCAHESVLLNSLQHIPKVLWPRLQRAAQDRLLLQEKITGSPDEQSKQQLKGFYTDYGLDTQLSNWSTAIPESGEQPDPSLDVRRLPGRTPGSRAAALATRAQNAIDRVRGTPRRRVLAAAAGTILLAGASAYLTRYGLHLGITGNEVHGGLPMAGHAQVDPGVIGPRVPRHPEIYSPEQFHHPVVDPPTVPKPNNFTTTKLGPYVPGAQGIGTVSGEALKALEQQGIPDPTQHQIIEASKIIARDSHIEWRAKVLHTLKPSRSLEVAKDLARRVQILSRALAR